MNSTGNLNKNLLHNALPHRAPCGTAGLSGRVESRGEPRTAGQAGRATPGCETTPRRRALLEAAVRWPLVGGVALLCARLLTQRTAGPLDPRESCTNQGLCRGCRTLPDCRSPQAELFRRGAPPDGRAPERRLT